MNIALIYQYIYIIIVAIVTVSHLNRYKRADIVSCRGNQHSTILLMAAATLFIGLRPISGYFVDMGNYKFLFQRLQGDLFVFDADAENLIFDNFLNWWGCNDFNLHVFFLIIAAIYFGCSYLGIRRLFGDHSFIAYLVFLAAFSTFSYGTNGIKAGAAASIFIWALSYWDKLIVCVPLMLASLGFHHSMIMPIAAFVVILFYKNPKWFYYGWFVCFLLSVLHVDYFQFLFAGMADEQGSEYLRASEAVADEYIGFRPDFVLYSALPVWIGYRTEMIRKQRLSKTYSMLMHFYLTTNAVWMLCMYASFTNRIAYLSWFVYPIVVIYPYLDHINQNRDRFVEFRKIVLLHLGFTMFMMFIYYGLLALSH